MNPSDLTILIVDDEPLIAQDIYEIIESDGFNVLEPSHDYYDALKLLRSNKIDLAVLDINLEGEKSGIDLAKIIRKEFSIPYIFLTSYSDNITLELAKEASPYGYLVKPLQQPTLLATIKIAYSNHQQILKSKELNFLDLEVSEREKSICGKLAKGMSYQEIADSEFISLNTVRYHIKNLYVKFNVKNSSSLISLMTS